MKSNITRFPLLSYYVLTFLFSGLILGVLYVVGLVGELFFLGTFGPGLAAIVVTALIGEKAGVRKLLGSLLVWRGGMQWWLVALLLPAVIYFGASVLSSQSGWLVFDFRQYQPVYTIILMIILLTLLNGVGEELGWRGFMLLHLGSRYSALAASLLVGLFWGLWHAPIYFIEGTAQFILREQVGFWIGFLLFTGFTIFLSVTFTWVFNHTYGSVLITSFLHGANNAWINYFMVDPTRDILSMTIWSTLLWAIFALGLILIFGPKRLSRSSNQQNI